MINRGIWIFYFTCLVSGPIPLDRGQHFMQIAGMDTPNRRICVEKSHIPCLTFEFVRFLWVPRICDNLCVFVCFVDVCYFNKKMCSIISSRIVRFSGQYFRYWPVSWKQKRCTHFQAVFTPSIYSRGYLFQDPRYSLQVVFGMRGVFKNCLPDLVQYFL